MRIFSKKTFDGLVTQWFFLLFLIVLTRIDSIPYVFYTLKISLSWGKVRRSLSESQLVALLTYNSRFCGSTGALRSVVRFLVGVEGEMIEFFLRGAVHWWRLCGGIEFLVIFCSPCKIIMSLAVPPSEMRPLCLCTILALIFLDFLPRRTYYFQCFLSFV